MKNYHSLVEEANKLLNLLDKSNSNVYLPNYVIARFNKTAEKYPQDILVCSMRDVLVKQAKNKVAFSQEDIGNLYSEMYGLGGANSSFKQELGDLLPTDSKQELPKKDASYKREYDNKIVEAECNESDLINSFSVIFNLESPKNIKFADNSDIKQQVSYKLSSLGKIPTELHINEQNEHFALCTAVYQDRQLRKAAVYIPVQIQNGKALEPDMMIEGSNTVPLNKENLYVYLKESNHYKDFRKQASLQRDSGLNDVSLDKVIVPTTLENFAKFENDNIKVAKFFSSEQLEKISNMLHSEIKGITGFNSKIKVFSADQNIITFKVELPLANKFATIYIPVEHINSRPLLPAKFASAFKTDNKVFDFSQDGFSDYFRNLSKDHTSTLISRDSGPMSTMSYQQLNDKVIEAVASKDYRLAEDAIGVISSRFDQDLVKKSLDKYSELLKYASEIGNPRQEFIKKAEMKGELIRIPTTIELYNPKLGLPISKIDFDSEGTMYPKGRLPKYDNLNSEVNIMSNYKIILS